MNYDIIGDIHGHARTLEALLDQLGYVRVDGVYRHAKRTVIFLGDFIDRGPYQRGVIGIVRPMIEGGAAMSVMGNHEFNAIAFATPKPQGGFLREHNDRNWRQHRAFLNAYADARDYHEVLDWFSRLPLWLDLGPLRIVHACWDSKAIARIAATYGSSGRIDNGLLLAAATRGKWEFRAVETLLKGKEISLPAGKSFHDKDGILRREMRVRWWDHEVTTYRQAYMGPEEAETHIPDDEIQGDHLIEYSHEDPPLFLGHYWLTGTPTPLASNIACLDYSVAQPGGKLTAYRWDGETRIDPAKFVTVDTVEIFEDEPYYSLVLDHAPGAQIL